VTALRALASTPDGVEVECTGRSMEPTLHAGDRVRVRRQPVHAGDVVLFEADEGVVLHRVIVMLPTLRRFIHCGDAGAEGGPGIASTERIIGRALLPPRRPGLASYLAAGRALLRVVRERF
jgi:hypothetical protein